MAYIPNLSLNIDALNGVLIAGPYSAGVTNLELTRGDLVQAEVLVFARKSAANSTGSLQTDMAVLDPEPGQQFRIGIFDKDTGQTLVFSDAFTSNPIVLAQQPVEVVAWNGTYSIWRLPFTGGSFGYGTANYHFTGASTFNFSISGSGTLNASISNDLNNQLNSIANDYISWGITYPQYRAVQASGKTPAKATFYQDKDGNFGWEVVTYFDFGVAELLSTSGPNGGSLMSSQRGWFGSFDLSTTELTTWLATDFSKQAIIEAEITEPGGDKRTILQQEVTINRDYINNDAPTHPIPDPTYCQTANSLSDVASAADARTNIDVYSKAETDAAIAAAGGGGGGGGIADAPSDGNQYARKDGAWAVVQGDGAGIADAPGDSQFYCRQNYAWTPVPAWNGGTVGAPINVTGSGGTVSLSDSAGLDLSGSTAGALVKFADGTTQSTAAGPSLATGDYYWMFVDHIDNYGSYCHIHHNSTGGGPNFPRGFVLWFTEALTGYTVSDPNAYADQYGNVPYACYNYGNFIELWWYSFGGQVKYANSRLMN